MSSCITFKEQSWEAARYYPVSLFQFLKLIFSFHLMSSYAINDRNCDNSKRRSCPS